MPSLFEGEVGVACLGVQLEPLRRVVPRDEVHERGDEASGWIDLVVAAMPARVERDDIHPVPDHRLDLGIRHWAAVYGDNAADVGGIVDCELQGFHSTHRPAGGDE